MKRVLPPKRIITREDGSRGFACRGCGKELPRTRTSWCSSECHHTHYMALSSYARAKVYDRDKGVCALCGFDTARTNRLLRSTHRAARRMFGLDDYDARELVRPYHDAICAAVFGCAGGFGSPLYTPNLWEADHRIPLVEGGSNDLSNYRTLCVKCHKSETKALAGRRAERHREPRS